MRLGRDAMVFTKHTHTKSCGATLRAKAGVQRVGNMDEEKDDDTREHQMLLRCHAYNLPATGSHRPSCASNLCLPACCACCVCLLCLAAHISRPQRHCMAWCNAVCGGGGCCPPAGRDAVTDLPRRGPGERSPDPDAVVANRCHRTGRDLGRNGRGCGVCRCVAGEPADVARTLTLQLRAGAPGAPLPRPPRRWLF